MVSLRSINPVVRATMVMAAVVVLAGGVTFAALQSQATLTNNTIASGTANLQVDNTDDGTNPLGATDLGYAFMGVIPGGAGSNTGNFSLKNNGTAALTLKAGLTAAPVWTVLPSGTVDNTKVHVLIGRNGAPAQDILLSDLVAPAGVTLTGGNLAAGITDVFTVQVKMDADAFTGTGASSANFQFVFTGTGS
jgi:predicted ribosomally synthesized peptide with SipW-like signal peptide